MHKTVRTLEVCENFEEIESQIVLAWIFRNLQLLIGDLPFYADWCLSRFHGYLSRVLPFRLYVMKNRQCSRR